MIKLTDKEVDVSIGEYQACHRNRNHYDSVEWTIGSIFIAVSLALIGFSFTLEFSREICIIGQEVGLLFLHQGKM
jgi:glucose uptake protein GlcU